MNQNSFKSMILAIFVPFTPLYAGQDVDEQKDAAVEGLVTISNVRGDIFLEGWDRAEIRISGELDDLAEELIFDVAGDRTNIEVKLPKRDVNWGDGSDLTIMVPRGSRIDFEGVSTDVAIRDIDGGVRAKTVSGDIRGDNLSQQMIMSTVSGEIDVTDSSGKARFSTVSGEVDLQLDSESVTLDTVSGEIEAELGQFAKVRANGVSGDLEISGELMAGGEVEISSVNSDIRLDLKSPVNANVRIETGPGGDIANDLNDDDPEERFPASHELNTLVGNGQGSVYIRTISGDIRIGSD